MPNLDLIGKTFGKLTVVCLERKPAHWFCRCECGETRVVRGTELVHAKAKACGRKCGRSFKHGYARGRGTPEYRSWYEMVRRCTASHRKEAKWYRDRGIKVCDRWLNDFTAFLADMGPKPSPKHSIDRINNDGNYEPGNCRWATMKEQIANRRRLPAKVEKRVSA